MREYSFKQFTEDSARTISTQFHANDQASQDRLHFAVGLVTEIAELMNAFTIEGTVKDEISAAEEIGDALWYWTIIVRNEKLDDAWMMSPFTESDIELPHTSGADNVHLLRVAMLHAVDVLDYVGKKLTFYGKEYDRPVLLVKLAPVMSCLETLAGRINHTPEECMKRVINKLKIRYPEKFDAGNADVRDLESERKALEKQ